jgi:formylglycine-generating enzyme required for sulfatase activity
VHAVAVVVEIEVAHLGDLSGDGVVSGENLAMILANWGVIAWQPSIASVTPAVGGTVGGTTATIRGSGFDASTTVTIGGAAATVVANPNPTTLTVTTPPGQVGFRDVVVQAAGGSASAVGGFRYATAFVPSWATLLEASPDPAIVTSASLRAAIMATGYAWRVRDNLTQIEMVLIPPGTFNMGCSASNVYTCFEEEYPIHTVTLTNAFYMGRYEVTQAHWTARMGTNPSRFQGPSYSVPAEQVPSRPVEQVSWGMTQDFLVGTGLRLPTEAEWEYSYRAGTTTAYHGWWQFSEGTNADGWISPIAWHYNSSGAQTRQVGQFAPNGFGLHDMAGNVWEWVNDWYGSGYYADSPSVNPVGPPSGGERVRRGGCWASIVIDVRASNRTLHIGAAYDDSIGFRVARNP